MGGEVIGIDPLSGTALRIEWEGEIIHSVSSETATESLPYLSRPFFDIQLNGLRGIDYTGDFDTADIERVIRALGRSGTGFHLPTIITSSREQILKNLAAFAHARRESPLVAACVPGVHVEGPFISEIDGPRGAHDAKYVRDPSVSEVDEWVEAGEGVLSLVTLAPERSGASDVIDRLVSHGVRVGIGHTAAARADIRAAATHGASISTHLGNGSHAQVPRLHNYVWAQLGDPRLLASVISDGHHLPDDVLYSFFQTKGADRTIIVSDAAPVAGLEPKEYRWGDLKVELPENGPLRLSGTEFLAGAATLLDAGLVNFMRVTGEPLATALRLVTVNPARFVGMPWDSLTVGSAASFVTFERKPAAHRLAISRLVVSGHELFAQDAA